MDGGTSSRRWRTASKGLPHCSIDGMIKHMNMHMPTASNCRHVACDAGVAPFAGRGKSVPRLSAVSIIRIIQGR
jgi:hypothetical protein